MNNRGIFFFDPGVSTGMAWGVFDLKSETVIDAMKNRINSGSNTFTTSGHSLQDAVAQAQMIFKHYSHFKRECIWQGLMDPDWIICGAENFILRPGMHTPGLEGIFPAYILGAFDGYRHGLYEKHRPRAARHLSPLVLQPAAMGMKFCNQKHLRSWDAWIVGRQHERSAFAHIGAYLMQNLI